MFRAELWCSEPELLVHQVWLQAQSFLGRTFAHESRELLRYPGLPEIFECQEWNQNAANPRHALSRYKYRTTEFLENRSTFLWREELRLKGAPAYILGQEYPVNVGSILLAHNRLPLLWDVEWYDWLRMG